MMERIKLKILLTGFKGTHNSSKVLLDKIETNCNVEKLYLENDFCRCTQQLKEKLKYQEYDLVISFGQKPITKSICLETVGYYNQLELLSNYDYEPLIRFLEEKNYGMKLSKRPGNYLCNHIFFHGLQYIKENSMKTKMIFIHIPYLKNIVDIDYMGKAFSEFIDMYLKRV